MADDVTISVQSSTELGERLQQGRLALARSSVSARQQAMVALADALEAAQDDILEANTLDLETSLEMAVPDLVVDWLRLTPDRLHAATDTLRRLAPLELPAVPSLGEVGEGLTLGQWMPLGMVALVYEALPELGIIAAGLCLHTGNGLLLKGGNEASQTNQAIANVFETVLGTEDVPAGLVQFISTSDGESVRRWLLKAPGLDLLIPYGRPSLVQQIYREAQVPILLPAMGNCYLYWAPSAPAKAVATMVVKSHQGSPDPVNAIEKVLIDSQVSPQAIAELGDHLAAAAVDVIHWEAGTTPTNTGEESWQLSSLQRQVTLCPVPTMATAITWINQYSSGHGDAIATGSYQDGLQFSRRVRSTAVYVNRSPQFLRNPPQASAIALGIAGSYGPYRGPITRKALLCLKTISQGTL